MKKGRVIREIEKMERIDGVKMLNEGKEMKEGEIVERGGRVIKIKDKEEKVEKEKESEYEEMKIIEWKEGF